MKIKASPWGGCPPGYCLPANIDLHQASDGPPTAVHVQPRCLCAERTACAQDVELRIGSGVARTDGFATDAGLHVSMGSGLSLRGGEKTSVTPTEMNVHGDTLGFLAMGLLQGWRSAIGGWRLVAVGGWRLAVGSRRLVVPGGCP